MRVCVVGGGISGLSAAHRLRQRGAEVDLLEGSARVGGLVGTERIEGCLLDHGPDSIVTDKPWALTLANELGLRGELIGTRDEPRGAYVVHDGKLVPVPDGFSLLAPTDLGALARTPLLSRAGKLRAALELMMPRRALAAGVESEDESVESFVVRRFGRELFERLAQPLAGGVYGADPGKLSLRATLPRLAELEQRHGSVIRGLRARNGKADAVARDPASPRYGPFAAFRDGMQTLVDALERSVGDNVQTRTTVSAIEGDERGYRVEARGTVTTYDAIVMAVPAHVAAQLVSGFDRALADELTSIEYASAATVTLSYPRRAIAHPLDAFGFAVPAIEHCSLVACTWASAKYDGRAPDDKALLRVFIGGYRGQHLVDYADGELIALAQRELTPLLGLSANPGFAHVRRYTRALPQYHIGHFARVSRIEQLAARHRRFALAGNAYHGIGISDAVHSGERAAEQILRDTSLVDAPVLEDAV